MSDFKAALQSIAERPVFKSIEEHFGEKGLEIFKIVSISKDLLGCSYYYDTMSVLTQRNLLSDLNFAIKMLIMSIGITNKEEIIRLFGSSKTTTEKISFLAAKHRVLSLEELLHEIQTLLGNDLHPFDDDFDNYCFLIVQICKALKLCKTRSEIELVFSSAGIQNNPEEMLFCLLARDGSTILSFDKDPWIDVECSIQLIENGIF